MSTTTNTNTTSKKTAANNLKAASQLLSTKFEKLSINVEGKNRPVSVKSFTIVCSEIIEFMKATKDVRGLSFAMLDRAKKLMKAQEYGDSSRNNFALSMFENALDWRLGWTVVNYIQGYLSQGYTPKPFKIAVDNKGNLYIITFTGKVKALAV